MTIGGRGHSHLQAETPWSQVTTTRNLGALRCHRSRRKLALSPKRPLQGGTPEKGEPGLQSPPPIASGDRPERHHVRSRGWMLSVPSRPQHYGWKVTFLLHEDRQVSGEVTAGCFPTTRGPLWTCRLREACG